MRPTLQDPLEHPKIAAILGFFDRHPKVKFNGEFLNSLREQYESTHTLSSRQEEALDNIAKGYCMCRDREFDKTPFDPLMFMRGQAAGGRTTPLTKRVPPRSRTQAYAFAADDYI